MPRTRQQVGACVCTFKRDEHASLEYGIAVLESPGDYSVDVIVDSQGIPLPDAPWTYTLHCQHGSFTFHVPKEVK